MPPAWQKPGLQEALILAEPSYPSRALAEVEGLHAPTCPAGRGLGHGVVLLPRLRLILLLAGPESFARNRQPGPATDRAAGKGMAATGPGAAVAGAGWRSVEPLGPLFTQLQLLQVGSRHHTRSVPSGAFKHGSSDCSYNQLDPVRCLKGPPPYLLCRSLFPLLPISHKASMVSGLLLCTSRLLQTTLPCLVPPPWPTPHASTHPSS